MHYLSHIRRALALACLIISFATAAHTARAADYGCTNESDNLVPSCALNVASTVTAERAFDFLSTLGGDGGFISQAQANALIAQYQYVGFRKPHRYG